MFVDSVRVQNFRCIRDSGEVPLTTDLTVLIGENESGKTSLLDALAYFNSGEDFQDADLSTLSPTREAVLSGSNGKDSIDIVTVSIRLSGNDREVLNIPESVLPGDLLRVTKRLDNSYVITGANGTPIAELYGSIKNSRLLTEIRGIRRQLSSVYQGAIVRKLPQDQFVFLRRSEGDPESADLILFPNVAGDLWDELSEGDVVQVSNQAPDPYGRNVRAMNVGKLMAFEDELDAVESAASLEAHELNSKIATLLQRIRSIPPTHPLRSVFSEDFQNFLSEVIGSGSDNTPWDECKILSEMPSFQRIGICAVGDNMPLDPDGPTDDGEHLNNGLQALVDEVGLNPVEAVMSEPTDRVRIFDDRSKRLSELFTASWAREVQAEFVPFNQDKEIGLAITCQGSLDPPSRRSQGFNSYLGLTARLLEVGKSANGNLVLLMDDPAMHLHPTAQEKLADMLGKQQFQVIAATHFPFMITSQNLDRVRLMCRSETGAFLEEDWEQGGNGLLPIRGALSRWTLGKVPVLVEGDSDREVLIQMSAILKGAGQDCLSPIIEPLPSGGSGMPHTAKALRAMGVKFIALVDGDRQGDDNRRKLTRDMYVSEAAIVSLRDVVSGIPHPAIEQLFSDGLRETDIWAHQKLGGLLKELTDGRQALDKESEDNLNLLFQMLNEALDSELNTA